MSLGGDISAALPGLRAEAESMMTDTVTVTRESDPVLNETTGQLEPTVTTVYSGPARLKLNSSQVSEVDAAGQLLGVQQPRLDLPVVGSAGVSIGDLFTVTASGTDEALVGLSGRVAGLFPQTYATARRFPIEIAS